MTLKSTFGIAFGFAFVMGSGALPPLFQEWWKDLLVIAVSAIFYNMIFVPMIQHEEKKE